MPRVNVMQYVQPAQTTGEVPCHTEIQAAIKAAGPHGIVYFPTGKYLITKPLVAYVKPAPEEPDQREGPVSFQGDGWQSAIIVKLDANNVGGAAVIMNGSTVVDGFPSKAVEGVAWRDIAILGASINLGTAAVPNWAYPCGVGLYAEFVLRSSFRNVHVLMGASIDAIYLRSGWSNYYNFISSVELAERLYGFLPVSTAAYPPNTLVDPPHQKHIHGAAGSQAGGLNANVFDCLVEGSVCRSHGADLLHIEPQDWPYSTPPILNQGNNLITGTYEGTLAAWNKPITNKCPPDDAIPTSYTGRAVVLRGCYQPALRDFHLEQTGGLVIENCEGPSVEQGTVQDVSLIATRRALLDQLSVATLSIDAASSFTRLGSISYEGKDVSVGSNVRGLGLSDASSTTVSLGSGPYIVRGKGVRLTAAALTNGDNLVRNGDFSRWLSTGAEGWSASGGALTQATGTEARRPGTSVGKFTSGTGAGIPYAAYRLEGVSGEWVGVSGYVRIPANQPGTVVELALKSTAGTTVKLIQADQIATDNGAWTRLEAVFPWEPGSVHDVVFHIRERAANAAVVMYVADVQASEGLIAPSHTFVPPANVADSYQLAGRRISYGSAKPSGGTARQGDIVYNTNPAPGQPVGWVCTAEPATWNGFGVVQTP